MRKLARMVSTSALAVVVLFMVIPNLRAEVPSLISIQGTLEAPGGGPLTGTHAYEIQFFNDALGGSLLYDVTGDVNLSVAGRFSLQIIAEPNVLAATEAWYQLAIDANDDGLDPGDLFPDRVRILSVPFALLSADSEHLGGMPAEEYSTDTERELRLTEKSDAWHDHDEQYWSLQGNVWSATNQRILGSMNEMPLSLFANGDPALRLEPNSGTTNIVGGFPGNIVVDGASGGTVSGGGTPGEANSVLGDYGTVGGGSGNTARDWTTVSGGQANSASASFSTVSGGWMNVASGPYSTIPGGSGNASQGSHSFAAGRRAKANHDGCFVWADSTEADFATTLKDQFMVRANGGAWFQTGAGGFYVYPNNVCPSVVGGFTLNYIDHGVVGAAIGGGGANTAMNGVTDNYGVVGGGKGNVAGDSIGSETSAIHATVSGGRENTASGTYAAIGGGWENEATAFGATIGGGSGNVVEADYGTIAGGGPEPFSPYKSNLVTDHYGTIGGGTANQAGNNSGSKVDAGYATVCGGLANTAQNEGTTVCGGWGNKASWQLSFIGGGTSNTASYYGAVVSGGDTNNAAGSCSAIAGGSTNSASGGYATIGGGWDNEAVGYMAAVPGGCQNRALGDHSFAAGCYANAGQEGTFVWADSQTHTFASSVTDEFAVRCTGGARFITAIDGNGMPSSGVALPPGANSWQPLALPSDRNLKKDFEEVDGRNVLQRLTDLSIETWRYKQGEIPIRHMGPMAQDFYAAFGLGEDNKHINPTDTNGVALAAIQGLHELVKEKDAELAQLHSRLDKLEALVAKLSQSKGAKTETIE